MPSEVVRGKVFGSRLKQREEAPSPEALHIYFDATADLTIHKVKQHQYNIISSSNILET